MRAVLFHGPGRLTVEDVPLPRLGPGDALVKVETALTCGTDLKAYLRGHRLFRPPMPFGHELTGHVADVGNQVTRCALGDRVVVANSAPCRGCYYCRRGQTSLCDQLDAMLNWGAYAEYIRIPSGIVEQNLHVVGPEASDVALAAVEPLACVVSGVDAAAVRSGDVVVVLGATGAIGLMFIQLLHQAGAGKVIAVGRSPERLALARTLGADLSLSADSDLAALVRGASDGRGADVVIEATGLPEVWEMAPDLARKGGTVVMFGGCPAGTRFSLDAGRVHYEMLTIRGVFHHTPATVERALSLILDGRVKIEPLVGAVGSLEEVEALLRRMASRELIKAAVKPGS